MEYVIKIVHKTLPGGQGGESGVGLLEIMWRGEWGMALEGDIRTKAKSLTTDTADRIKNVNVYC